MDHLAEVDVLAVREIKFQRQICRLRVDVNPLPHTQSEARRSQIGDVIAIRALHFEGNRNRLGIALVHICVRK